MQSSAGTDSCFIDEIGELILILNKSPISMIWNTVWNEHNENKQPLRAHNILN